ncbi:T9SS type B sorting domain-containing protein [uncultured Olleya sp.]|uniref:T9SS type B sorting domain-containing protein n=1 Tax=uncultured Olleya sp. TaxID=757243 RepID=UPI0025960C4B|nr:T9SS type B sorting domain-containing protein [uncultured Olleya sp.]
MKKIFLVLILLCSFILQAQNEAANWYFGDNAGIQFNTNTNAVTALTDGQLATEEGCTSISDSDGNLLFYTNGENVFDKQHNIMQNGTGLLGNQSSTQSAIIIPKPQDDEIYYIFTQDTEFLSTPDNGFNYSIVDMSLNNGLGAVITKNQLLLHKASEKLSAVLKDCQSQNIWVVTYADSDALTNINAVDNNNNTFYAFEVSSALGVNPIPVISTIPFTVTEKRGYLKFSPDGTKIALANIGQGIQIYDFDTASGIVSNRQEIQLNFSPTGKRQSIYGIEFSPNSQILYASTYYEAPSSEFNNPNAQYSGLLQYNLNTIDISLSETILDERIMYRSALQLGPDGKIYRSLSATYDQGIPFLSVINNPNELGQNSNYQHQSISLNNNVSRQGLPPFITSFFAEKIDIIPSDSTNTVILPLCSGDHYTLTAEYIIGATYTWTKDGVILATPSIPNQLLISENGNYEVIIDQNNGDCDIKEGQAIVTYYNTPSVTEHDDLIICSDDTTSTINLSIIKTAILNGQNPLNFDVTFHLSQLDADLKQNQLPYSYETNNTQETIFARIFNLGNNNCYDTTSFNVEIYNTPVIDNLSDYETCDDTTDGDDTNGQTSIDLTNFNMQVFGSQSTTLYNITYHSTQNDADLGTNTLPNNYYNTTPITETIFVRLENSNNTDCFTTNSFNITVNPVPEAYDDILFQCDEDGVPDGQTIFNLNEASVNITNNNNQNTTAFYTTFSNAQSETSPINGDAYSNTTNPQTIYVVVTDTITNCIALSELTLEVSVTQTNDYIAPPVCDELGSEDGINTFDLDSFSTEITNGLPAGITVSYYGTYDDALLEVNALPSLYNNTIPYNEVIYARAENNNACYGISEVLLTINPLPQITEDETVLYCLNQFPETIQLTATNTVNPNYYYNWSTGETTAFIEINTIGQFTVTVTTAEGCPKTKTFTVQPSNIATIEDIIVVDGSLNNNVVTILTSGEGDYAFELINAEGLSTGFQNNNIFTNIKPGIYHVNITDIKNNCGTIDQMFSVIGFPLFFTPNDDGKNDYWQVYGVSSQFQANSIIQIFDRYGKLLKELTPNSQGWDGTFNGQPLPTNDYWFTVELQDGRIYRNHFTLKR